MTATYLDSLLSIADDWICDDYSLDIRYIAIPSPEGTILVGALVRIYPWRNKSDSSFHIHSDNIWVGHIQRYPLKKLELVDILRDASNGLITLPGARLTLHGKSPFDYYSEMAEGDRWYSELHLKVSGESIATPSQSSRVQMDNALRSAATPFDGIRDVVNWLGLDASAFSGGRHRHTRQLTD